MPLFKLCLVVVAVWGLQLSSHAQTNGLEFFESKIRPVLVEHCYSCHSADSEKLKGGLRVDTKRGLLDGGTSGPAIVPGELEESLLLQAIAHTDDFSKMPPKQKLPDRVIGDFREWVRMGAPDPRDGAMAADEAASDSDRNWWSLRPLQPVAVPVLDNAGRDWAKTPIDAFLFARLRENGLAPAPEADRRTLIRRLSFDLLGLPPSPEEIDGFLADQRPDAYERLVDRLLASSHYGERWARHWMDLVHFAETHGHDQDRIREHAWPYRDYLIASFNRDVPYPRFIQEQVAGDALFPDQPELAVALGMIAAGPWDESSLRDIRDDSIDRQIGHYIDRDDMVSTVMSTFVSLTVHCARCHNHKFDPISQDDYYALQAVFAGVDRADREYELDAATARQRASLQARRDALRARTPEALASLRDPSAQSSVAAWEAELQGRRSDWTILKPAQIKAASKAELVLQEDGSIFAQGPNPAEETYTIAFSPGARLVTGVRLEVLPDDRLSSRGPGRNDNGNLHLTEIEVRRILPGQPNADAKPLPIRRAVADFNQDGWLIEHAIDGDSRTAWGVFPQVGKPHEAVFELADDLTLDDGDLLECRLVQTYAAGHAIGRFRLSVTGSARPLNVIPLPEPITAILKIPLTDRTDSQIQELALHHAIEDIGEQLAMLPPRKVVYAAASDFKPDAGHKPPPGPRTVYLLKRGDIHQPGTIARPGTLGCVEGLPSRFTATENGNESTRREALAAWISDPANPLTYRSIVNRIWQHHFGRGIVETPNDFGVMGASPSHPELLDWLAGRFLEDGGSIKRLHRLIVTSAGYRQSARHDARSAEIDADNRLLWRANRRRLDAESVHDAILAASGKLDPTMGGPSVRQFGLCPGVHVTPVVDYTKYDWGQPGSGRRSVYRFLFRTLPDPFMDNLDEADASQLTAVRNESVTPLQALAMLHNPFVIKQSEHLADRLVHSAATEADRIRLAYALLFGRPPTDDEVQEMVDFAKNQGLTNACRILMNSNEFLFVN